jgi:ATP-dependent metalloprotease FtsH
MLFNTKQTILHLKQFSTVYRTVDDNCPRIDDIIFEVDRGKKAIHLQSIKDTYYVHEPKWANIQKISYFEFYLGLRERNWTSKYYRANAEPWRIEFFRDSGRFLRLNVWDGYRAVITKSNGDKFWVDLDFSGSSSFMLDYQGSGTIGSIFRRKRGGSRKPCIEELGYNQVFEEVFGAFEQQLTDHEKNIFFDNEYWVEARQIKYNAPGERKLDITWNWTSPEYAFGPYLKMVPKAIFWGIAYSFILISIGISLFSKEKKPPIDIQGAIEFSYSKADARKDGKVDVKFCDVAGIENVLDQLKEIVEILNYLETTSNKKMKARAFKGVLLEGEAGTGKTLMAKAIAGEAGVAFYQIAGAEFIQAIGGVGAARVRDIFRRARVNKPSVIFIDEIDAIGVRRAEFGAKAAEEREQTLNQLLTEMDGFSPREGVILIAATNRADLLDPALLRAGRFDRKLTVNKPDVKGREAILKVNMRKFKVCKSLNLTQIACNTPGLSAADLENLFNYAGLEAIRRVGNSHLKSNEPNCITTADLSASLDYIQHGIKAEQYPCDSWQTDLLAGSESGKAILASVMRANHGHIEKVSKISIVAHSRRDSLTNFTRINDDYYFLQDFAKLKDRITFLCAGRAAEEVLFGTHSSKTLVSFASGLRVARHMVYRFGFCEFWMPLFAPTVDTRNFSNTCVSKVADNLDLDTLCNSILPGELEIESKTKQMIESVAFLHVYESYYEAINILEAYQHALKEIAISIKKCEEMSGPKIISIIEKNPPSKDRKSTNKSLVALFIQKS